MNEVQEKKQIDRALSIQKAQATYDKHMKENPDSKPPKFGWWSQDHAMRCKYGYSAINNTYCIYRTTTGETVPVIGVTGSAESGHHQTDLEFVGLVVKHVESRPWSACPDKRQ